MIFEVYRDDGAVNEELTPTRVLHGFKSYTAWKNFTETFDPKDFPGRVRPRLIHTFFSECTRYHNED